MCSSFVIIFDLNKFFKHLGLLIIVTNKINKICDTFEACEFNDSFFICKDFVSFKISNDFFFCKTDSLKIISITSIDTWVCTEAKLIENFIIYDGSYITVAWCTALLNFRTAVDSSEIAKDSFFLHLTRALSRSLNYFPFAFHAFSLLCMHSNGLWHEKKGIEFQPHTDEKSTFNSESSHTQTHKRRKRVKRNLALLFIFARKAHDPWHIDKWVIRCRHHRKLVFFSDSHGIYSFAFFFLENSRNEAFLMGKICEQIKRTIRDKWISRCKDIFKNFFSIFFLLAFGIAYIVFWRGFSLNGFFPGFEINSMGC